MALRTGRRTVLRTAAWSAPVIAVVTAAPAFAGTGPANLSTSTANMAAVTRAVNGTGSKITIPTNTVTFVNSGADPVEGITATMTVTSGVITEVYGMGQPSSVLAMFGVTVSGLGTNSVTLTVPAGLMTIPGGGTQALGFDLAADTSDQNAMDFTVTVSPLPTGVGVTFPTASFPAL